MNVLWISLEDCSPRLGCYGDAVARTPRIDRLASAGRLYRNAYSTAPVCAPARCAIITGMFACAIGGHHMRVSHTNAAAPRPIPPYECVPPAFVKILPEYFRAAGYFCSNAAKTDYQFAPPFTGWDELGKDAHWRNRPAGAPFFSVFNLEHAHESGMWPENRALPATDPAAVAVPPYLPDSPASRAAIAAQYDQIARNDARVGQILDDLERDGLAEETLVVLWADHGEGLPRHKRWPFSSGLRVPLVVRWPGRVAPGEISDELVSTIDLAPTMLSACGLDVPLHMQGRIFLGDSAAPPPRMVFATRDRFDEFYDCMRSAFDGRFRYVRNFHPELPRAQWNDYLNTHPVQQELWKLHRAGRLSGPQEWLFAARRPPEELYDSADDPHETRNLAGDPAYRGTLDGFRAALAQWQEGCGDLYAEPEEQMVRRFWPDLRQPTTEQPVFVPYDETHSGIEPAGTRPVSLEEPCFIQLYCPTQGASVGFRFASDPPGRWRLYSAPFPLPAGEHSLEAKAIRIGYAESPATSLEARVVPGRA